MKQIIALAGACALVSLSPALAAGTLSVDPPHTSATFSVKHLTITTVSGKIGIKDVALAADTNGLPASVSVTLDPSTVDTGVADRDADLRSERWFDVAAFPAMTFKSTSITGSASAFQIAGDLTIRGVTKPVTLAAKLEGSVKDQKGRTHTGYSATTTIDRTAWNLGPGFPSVVVGNEVTITIQLEAIAQGA